MKTIYIAYDGTEFDSRSDCETYEKIHIASTNGFKALSLNLKPLTFEEVINNGDFDYIKATKEQLSIINNIVGLDIYPEDGEYVYDWNDGKWIDLNETIKNLEDKLSRLSKVKKMLEEENK